MIKEMPMIGLGTWKLKGQECKNAVMTALKLGYRHIDTAAIYYNEKYVGEGIKASGVPRKDIFLVSKLAPQAMVDTQTVLKCAEQSLEDLQTDYFDLYLMHWPIPDIDHEEAFASEQNAAAREMAWRAMEQLHRERKARHIGVSNFTEAHLTSLLSYCTVKPFLNQFEHHPFLNSTALIDFCRRKDILVEAYSSLGHGHPELLTNDSVVKIAERHGKSPGQVLLRWATQNGVRVIPKSCRKERIEQNFALDFDLGEEEMKEIDMLGKKGIRYCMDPNKMT